jgi:hypothetical protein
MKCEDESEMECESESERVRVRVRVRKREELPVKIFPVENNLGQGALFFISVCDLYILSQKSLPKD